MAGTIHHVETSAADIEDFDPSRDKLDLGGVSVHNFIVVDTPAGVGFMNPWSGQTQVLQGVSLGQLTVDSFVPIQNAHLQQDLSGALAWEHGVTPEPNIVHARSHEVGQVDKVAFDTATDVVDMRYYGTREQIYLTDGPEGAILGNQGTGQMLVLLGVSVAELQIDNFVFHAPQVYEDRLYQQLGFDSIPASQVWNRSEVPTAGTQIWPQIAGPGEPPVGETGTTFSVAWDHGSHVELAFDPAADRLDFGWFKADNFSVSEEAGSVVIRIAGNDQSYTLTSVTLAELGLHQILTLDAGARELWQQALAEASGVAPPDGGHHHDHDHGDDHGDDHGGHDENPGDPEPDPDPDPEPDPEPDDDSPPDPIDTPPEDPDQDAPSSGVAFVDYAVSDNWGSGFVADVTLTAGDQALDDWVLTFDATFDIINLWNAEILERDGDQYVIGAAPWNADLDSGESLTWGFQAVPGSEGTAADNWAVDGVVLDSDAPNEPNDDVPAPEEDPAAIVLEFESSASWGSGFNGNVSLQNTGNVAQSGWEVLLTLPHEIDSLWNAEIVGRDGDVWHIRQTDWNGEIAPEQSVSFGFTASGAEDPSWVDVQWLG